MELRWMYYPGNTAPLNAGTGTIYLGEGAQTFALVLQYRDGVTHDAPWLNVPMALYEPVRTNITTTLTTSSNK